MVDGSALALQFALNKYTDDWSAVDNDSVTELGAATNFRVDPQDTFPKSVIKYFVTGCELEGNNDEGNIMSYPVNNNIDCFSPIVSAGHRVPQELTFNMFAYGHSAKALASNVLKCAVHLCVGDACYDEYYAAKETCSAGYVARSETAPYSLMTEEPEAEQEAEPEVESAPVVEAEPEAEPEAELEAEPEAELEAKPEAESEEEVIVEGNAQIGDSEINIQITQTDVNES